jgi:uncharacterized membrane protein
MLIPGGVWVGIIVAYAVERTSLWERMPLEQYAVDFRRSLARVDPLQPILALISIAGSVAFALNSSATAASLAWSGIGLLAVVIVTSVAIAEPINLAFRRLSEGEVPARAPELRARWRRFHICRTAVALAAFACFVLATTYP